MFDDLEQLMKEIDKFKESVASSDELIGKLDEVILNAQEGRKNALKSEQTLVALFKEFDIKLMRINNICMYGIGLSVLLSFAALIIAIVK